MNPYYNQQQPYHNYHQHIPGPPQPQWQSQIPPQAPPQLPTQAPQSPGGWADPRFRPQSPEFAQNNFQSIPGPTPHYPTPPLTYPPPPPPPPPPVASGAPQRPLDIYNGPGATQYDTTQWGVKYSNGPPTQFHAHPDPQHSYQQDHKPALPPRPTSSMSHVSLNSHQSQHSQHQHHPSFGDHHQTPTQHQPYNSWNGQMNQSQEQLPPAPPPRPAAYASTGSYVQSGLSNEVYSHHAPTHQYDPHPQSQSTWQNTAQPAPQPSQQQYVPSSNASTWSSSQQHADTPVSPLDDERRRLSVTSLKPAAFVDAEPPSQNLSLPDVIPTTSAASVTASARPTAPAMSAFSGPSDWQHYDPTDTYDNSTDQDLSTPPPAPPVQPVASSSPLKTKHSIKRKSIERIRPARKPSTSTSPSQLPRETNPNDQPHGSQPKAPLSTQMYPPKPYAPQRQDSGQSSVSSVGELGRSETIDNVIQAWKAPMKADSAVQTSFPPSRMPSVKEVKPETSEKTVQTDFDPEVVTKIETRVETKVETRDVEVDPYADIQAHYKGTLKRFAAMLRQEASADGDEEKFKIFQGFVIRELKLRSVLYGVEAHNQDTGPAASSTRTDASKASPSPVVPALRPPKISTPISSQPKPEVVARKQLPASATAESTGISGSKGAGPPGGFTQSKDEVVQPQLPSLHTSQSEAPSTPTKPLSSDSNGGLDDEDGGDYSPGGRPRMSPLRVNTSQHVQAQQEREQIERPISPKVKAHVAGRVSPSDNAPMAVDDYMMNNQPSPSANAPMVVDLDSALGGPITSELTGPLNFQPARPLYTPFRYGEGLDQQQALPQVQPPMAESFAALRQTSAVESGRALVHDPPPFPTSTFGTPNRGQTKTPGGRQEHEEAFIGLLRAKSLAIRKNVNTSLRPESPAILRAGTPAARQTPTPAPVPPLVKSVQSLKSLIPESLPAYSNVGMATHPKLDSINAALQKFSDDFSFIHARVITWDQSNRQLRAKQDAERQARQSQNEEHIDHLFNDNEIGYADIGELEKDFKLEEAGRKYNEDKAELESFTKGVFDFVLEKIEEDMNELTKLQTLAIDLLDLESASAAKQIQTSVSHSVDNASNASTPMASAVMQVMLHIYEKLETRHLKVAEANFERERRRKRLESSILFTNNDRAGIRKLDAEFAKAEKIQVMEESRKKVERANRLMDSFDRAVVRGLAENQGMVDDVSSRLQLMRDLVMGSEDNAPAGPAREELLYGSDGVRDLMARTVATVDYIHNDSKALVQLLDSADTMSNNADFELYMSEAKLADASPDKYQKLKSEKEVEDRNVAEEMKNRLSGVSRVPDEITVLVREIRDKIGSDAGHEERVAKALEAAKMRNSTAQSGS